MTPEKCPCCSRIFTGVNEFLKVYLANVTREAIPENKRFPLDSLSGIFVDPEEKRRGLGNPAVPDAVIKLFAHRRRSEESTVNYHGWQWTRRLSGYIDTKTTPWTDHRTYHYDLDNNDRTGLIKNIVLHRVNKYLNRLEEQVGQEVPRTALVPPTLPSGYRTEFNNDLGETDKATGLNRVILRVNYHEGGLMYIVEPGSKVATVDYEGRLNY